MYRYFTIILLISLFQFAYSSNNANGKSMDNSYVPSFLTLNYSNDSICFTFNKKSTFLPKIELKKTAREWSNQKLIQEFHYNFKIKSIKERLEEISSLSKVLGVELENPSHIDLYRKAVEWLGTPYRYGGMSKRGTDCSGFTRNIFQEVYGINIERSSYAIARKLQQELSIEELEPGDLVFFTTRGKSRINHVGVYLGNRHFVHASIKSGVIVSSLDEYYYTRTFKKAGRL